jgi:ATP-binding cassette subfamily F protein 3
MINLDNISLHLGTKDIFSSAAVSIYGNEKIGLLGINGSGKTTLLRMLNNPEAYNFSGRITINKNIIPGYLPQEISLAEKNSLIDFVTSAFGETADMRRELEKLENSTTGADNFSAEEISEIMEKLRQKDGYRLNAIAGPVLKGLGFEDSDFHKPVNNFSGGWQVKAYLAKLLSGNYNFLLLDEPTNYLDIESILWLENFLIKTQKGMLIVSHDVHFLNKIIDHVISIENHLLKKHRGNVSDYFEQKEKEKLLLSKRQKKQKKEKEQIEEFTNRFRYKATKAKQVQSRIKKMEKMEEIAPVADEGYKIEISLPVTYQSGKEVVSAESLEFSYSSEKIIDNATFNVYRGEKIALLGKNGSGKSTLAKLIAGKLYPQKGRIKIFDRTRIGYFAQHSIENLNPHNTIIEELEAAAIEELKPNIRNILGLFRFSGEEQKKTIAHLSGGEKSRVALAKLFISTNNFIIFDEPSNHLDVYTKPALIEAIVNYPGACLIISHDLDLLSAIEAKIFHLKEGKLRIYHGAFDNFLRELMSGKENGEKKREIYSGQTASENQIFRKQKKELEREQRKAAREAEKHEEEIEKIEIKLNELKKIQLKPEILLDHIKSSEIQREIEDYNTRLERTVDYWEKAVLKNEELLKKIKDLA